MKKHVLILGAGFAGLELATRLSETLQDAVRVTLLDRNDSFVFGYSKLEVILGRQSADDVRLHYRQVDKDGVEFRQETVTAIDPPNGRSPRTSAPTMRTSSPWPWAPITTWTRRPASRRAASSTTPSPAPSGCATRWPTSTAGGSSSPCSGSPSSARPPRSRGRSCCTSTSRSGASAVGADDVDVPDAAPGPGDRRGLADVPRRARRPRHRGAATAPGHEHRSGHAHGAACERRDAALRPLRRHPDPRAPHPLTASGLAVNGWVPVDQSNLRTQFPQVYTLGDVCAGPRTVPKAGTFAESAALVVADDIAALIAGAQPPAPHGGSGVCYAEFGDGLVSKV